jgi:hypothetical protein
MLRSLVLCTAALLLATSCTADFKNRRTPSGEFCSDMFVIPAGDEPNLEYHRLQPVQSDIKAHTEAERLESLRKAACIVGGDAVIEAVNEEIRNEVGQYVLVSSGTSVVWVRPKGSEAVPLTTHKKPKTGAEEAGSAQPVATAPPAAPPSAAPVPTAAPVATPTAVASAPPSAAPTTAPSATPSASASAIKPKLPTNTAPKPINPGAPPPPKKK